MKVIKRNGETVEFDYTKIIKGFSKERYIEALKRTYTSPTEFTEI